MGEFFALWNWAALLIVGLFRAFGRPQVYRGKIFGSIFAVIAVLLVAFFSYEILYSLRQVPASVGARASGKRRLTFSSSIKMENLLVSGICFPTQRASW